MRLSLCVNTDTSLMHINGINACINIVGAILVIAHDALIPLRAITRIAPTAALIVGFGGAQNRRTTRSKVVLYYR